MSFLVYNPPSHTTFALKMGSFLVFLILSFHLNVKDKKHRWAAVVHERGGEQRWGSCLTHQPSDRSEVRLLTSKVISRTFLGICMIPESPSSPDTHTQGLEVVMALLSFLMGMMTTRYGITAGTNVLVSRDTCGYLLFPAYASLLWCAVWSLRRGTTHWWWWRR